MAIPTTFTAPSSKKVWDISEFEAGDIGTQDPAQLQVTKVNALDGVEMGTFVATDANGKTIKVLVGTTLVAGVALLDDKADDFENREFAVADQVPVMRRGFPIVKIDIANKPVVGSLVRISHDTDIEGYLTTNVSNSKQAPSVVIERVFDTVAEVYLHGLAAIPLT